MRQKILLVYFAIFFRDFRAGASNISAFCSAEGGYLYRNTTCFATYTATTETWSLAFADCEAKAASAGFPVQGRLAHFKDQATWENVSTNYLVPNAITNVWVGLKSISWRQYGCGTISDPGKKCNDYYLNDPKYCYWMSGIYSAETRADLSFYYTGNFWHSNGHRQDCFRLWTSGFDDVGCTSSRGYLCEFMSPDLSSAETLCSSGGFEGVYWGQQSCFKWYYGGYAKSPEGFVGGNTWADAFDFCTAKASNIPNLEGRLAIYRHKDIFETVSPYISAAPFTSLVGETWTGSQGNGSDRFGYYWMVGKDISNPADVDDPLDYQTVIEWYCDGAISSPGSPNLAWKSGHEWTSYGSKTLTIICEFVIQTDPCTSDPCQNGGLCVTHPHNDRYECQCGPKIYGSHCEDLSCVDLIVEADGTKHRDCASLKNYGRTSTGVYSISLGSNCTNSTGFPSCCLAVYCDMDTLGGGWTTIQKRYNGTVDFRRNWTDYEWGFGVPDGEHWIGLKYTHLITNTLENDTYDLLVTLKEQEKECLLFELMNGFHLFDDPCNNIFYQLNIASDSLEGNAHQHVTKANSMMTHNGYSFTTMDQDHDAFADNCAILVNGAWWFTGCHHTHLNAMYNPGCSDDSGRGLAFASARGFHYSFEATNMLIRPSKSETDPNKNNWCTDLSFVPCNTTVGNDCLWSEWSPWSPCSETCNTTAVRTRTRTFTLPTDDTWMPCEPLDTTEVENCSLKTGHCPIDCEWTEWSAAPKCSDAKGYCVQPYSRGKTIVEQWDGLCEGKDEMDEPCDTCFPMGFGERVASAAFQTMGCTWLLVLTGATFLSCAAFRILHLERLLHAMEELNILIAHICILLFRDFTDMPALCTVVSFVLQFTFTSTFTFFALEGFQMYSYITNVQRKGNFLSIKMNLLIGFGFPLASLALPAVIWYKEYPGKYTCWLNMGHKLSAFTVAPLLITTILTIIVIEAAGQGEFEALQGVNKEKRLVAMFNQRGLVLLVPVCAAHWFFGMWAVYAQHVAYYTSVFALNIALGLLILIFHGLIHTAVKIFFTRIYNKVKSCCTCSPPPPPQPTRVQLYPKPEPVAPPAPPPVFDVPGEMDIYLFEI